LDALRIDFAIHRGHEMIIDCTGGITRDKLDQVELSMLQAQRIPGLLHVEWVDIDGNIQFHYRLTGKRMISSWLRMNALTMLDFYSLLLSIVETMNDCKDYMLHPSGFVLGEQSVFMGERLGDIALAYVPLKEKGGQETAASSLLDLVIQWIGHVREPDGAGIQSVIRHLREEMCSWSDLRQTLLALIHNHGYDEVSYENGDGDVNRIESRNGNLSSAASQPLFSNAFSPTFAGSLRAPEFSQSPQPSYSAEKLERSDAFDASGTRGEATNNKDQTPEASRSQTLNSFMNDGFRPGQDALELLSMEEEDEFRKARTRHRYILLTVYIIVNALVWRYLYMESTTQANLLISAGLTLLLTAGAVLLWTKKRKDLPENEQQEGIQFSLSSVGGEKRAVEELGDERSSLVAAHRDMRAEGPRFKGIEQSQEGYASPTDGAIRNAVEKRLGMKQEAAPKYEAVPMYASKYEAAPTGMHSMPPANEAYNEPTVFLGDRTGQDAASGSTPYKDSQYWLEREAEGQLERVELEGNLFVIGRSGDSAQYVDASSGISRAHLELNQSDSQWTVKDIGSRNGSLLNGEAMIPYKYYQLQSGDIVQLAGEKGPKYAFRAS